MICSCLIVLIVTDKTNDMSGGNSQAEVISSMQIQPGLTKIFQLKAACDTVEAYRTLRFNASGILIHYCFTRRIEMYRSYLAL
jgi:hypothetical protein